MGFPSVVGLAVRVYYRLRYGHDYHSLQRSGNLFRPMVEFSNRRHSWPPSAGWIRRSSCLQWGFSRFLYAMAVARRHAIPRGVSVIYAQLQQPKVGTVHLEGCEASRRDLPLNSHGIYGVLSGDTDDCHAL